MKLKDIAIQAKNASIRLAVLDTEQKNYALDAVAAALEARRIDIAKANEQDMQRSEKEQLAAPLLKRLRFGELQVMEAVQGIKSLIGLEDPVGKALLATELDDGLELRRISCPIGVIGIIFESRPDALVQISSLCLKSGNSVLLKGGSEAMETNRILAEIIEKATLEAGIPTGWMHLLESRSDVVEMLKLDEWINLIIPRGSNQFVRFIMDNSRIPVMGHADGICHCYIDEAADCDMAVRITVDSKTQYAAVCNALETLLVHQGIANRVLPALKEEMDRKSVVLVGCPKTQEVIPVHPATEEDWGTEYLDYKLSIKIVEDMDEAISHIHRFGSGHTDAIVTKDPVKAEMFLNMVDSGNVLWNCSTRFSDGYRYGFGAEVGISTAKIHARGPVGLEGLLIYKYKLVGNGHIVQDYAGKTKTFKHNRIL